jgi:hypothetical protein
MKKLQILFSFVLAVFILFISCEKEEKADIRENIVGNFTGNQTYTKRWSLVNSTFSDSTTIHNVSIKVAIDSIKDDELIFTQDAGSFFLDELETSVNSNIPITYSIDSLQATNTGITFIIPHFGSGLGIGATFFDININENSKGSFTIVNEQLTYSHKGILRVYTNNTEGILIIKNVPISVDYLLTKH